MLWVMGRSSDDVVLRSASLGIHGVMVDSC
jgi:hypothetical protein